MLTNAQFQTILAGGKLIQHVTNHSGYHDVETVDNGTIRTNSIHHQMCYPWNLSQDDYIVLAYTLGNSTTYLDGWNDQTEFPEIAFENGVVKEPEIIWYPKLKSLSIQFHPELMWYKNVHEVHTLDYLNKIIETTMVEPYYYHELIKKQVK